MMPHDTHLQIGSLLFEAVPDNRTAQPSRQNL